MSQSTLAKQGGRRSTIVATAAALGLLVALALWAGWAGGAVSPRTVEGWAMPNASGTAISLHDSPEGGPGEGYIIAGAQWRGIDNSWHDGADIPTCVGTDMSSFTHVRLGLVTVETPDGLTWEQVAWLECLE